MLGTWCSITRRHQHIFKSNLYSILIAKTNNGYIHQSYTGKKLWIYKPVYRPQNNWIIMYNVLNNKCRTTLSKHTTKLQHQVHKTSALLSNCSVVTYFSIYQNLSRQTTQTSEKSVAYICLLWKPPKKSNKSCYSTSWKGRIHTSFRGYIHRSACRADNTDPYILQYHGKG